eukprot:1144966-Pelagomonas_calceolata.AAC.4
MANYSHGCAALFTPRLVASATLGPRLAQLPPTFFPLNKSVLAVGGPEAVRLLFFDASVADNCIVRQVGGACITVDIHWTRVCGFWGAVWLCVCLLQRLYG